MSEENLTRKPLKTYTNTKKTKRPVLLIKRVKLTTKKALELLLSGTLKTKVCRYCLFVTEALTGLDQILQIAGQGALYKVTVKDVVASFHPFKVTEDPNFPNKICDKCLNKALKAYFFAQQCEQTERALRNCFDDSYDQMQKLDPLERVKKRGRQKLHPNHNTLHTEHRYVIDYAEPLQNLICIASVSLTKEPMMSDLECKRCWQVLPNIESLVNHEKIHPKTMWYHCRICGKSFAKKYQINRHLRAHAKDKKLNTFDADTNFVCKTCGHYTEDCNVHLQHIEKHKFQTVLEHLVERKMDKLCAVCLEKKGKMADMDQTMRLHGGYPELEGDRTFFNILGSVLPEKHYKYQELYVGNSPKIMTIMRRSEKVIENEGVENTPFKLSPPILISVENQALFDDYVYLYIFSEPQTVSEKIIHVHQEIEDDIEDLNQNTSCITISELPDVEINEIKDDIEQQDKVEHVAITIETANISFDFSKPNYNIEEFCGQKLNLEDKVIDSNRFTNRSCNNLNLNENDFEIVTVDQNVYNKKADQVNDSNERGLKSQSCKFYWVFKHVEKCEYCNASMKTTDESMESKSDLKTTCQYCWVFKHTKKCEICNAAMKATDESNESNRHEETKTVLLTKELVLESKETVLESTEMVLEPKEMVNKAEKRKTASEITPAKKTKWQCNICLVFNNTNRETCICCESAHIYEDPVKVKFSFSKSFSDFIKTATAKVDNFDSNNNPKVSDTNLNVLDTNSIASSVLEKADENVQNNIEINMTDANATSGVTQTPFAPLFATNVITRPLYEETMDVIEEEPPNTLTLLPSFTSYPNPFSTAFTPRLAPTIRTPESFNFNIGAGRIEDRSKIPRRFKRSFRKISASAKKFNLDKI